LSKIKTLKKKFVEGLSIGTKGEISVLSSQEIEEKVFFCIYLGSKATFGTRSYLEPPSKTNSKKLRVVTGTK